jgi:DNA phosphorothioation system restriction enzyme
MSFLELEIPRSIKSTRVNPITGFFIPVLKAATKYDVAVGFFTTEWVRDAAEGVAHFAANGGEARWIISPILSASDYETLRDSTGEFAPDQIRKKINHSFGTLFAGLREDTKTVLGWLIKDGIIKFRVGVPVNELDGMLHAKMGIFVDREGNRVAFSGSYNLTKRAATNWERIDIYCDWKSEDARERVQEIEDDIKEMWGGHDTNLKMYEPSDEALQPFLREADRTSRPYSVLMKVTSQERFSVPPDFLIDGKLRQYQESAISAWLKNNGRGVFSLATGAGKTVTALAAVSRVANFHEVKQANLLVVATVPYHHLADQWAKEAAAFGFTPVVCYGGHATWIKKAQQAITAMTSGLDRIVFFVAVNDTFQSELFQRLLSGPNRSVLLIADEMHNLGASSYLSMLPTHVRFRLGLSATPIRHGDEEGTKGLEQYFGPVVGEFTLGDAIKSGFLCPYYYYPVPAELNADEMVEYKDLSVRIGKAFAAGGGDEDQPGGYLQALLIERARLISRISSKLALLGDILREKKDTKYNLVYCGDAKDEGVKQVDKALQLIGVSLQMKANKFTAEESADERRVLLDEFSKGERQVLVAIRCLDEGVDVPRTETAYILASSTNPRQYIQRRGRVLRNAPGKKTATIYDFIAVPNLEDLARTNPAAFEIERRLVRKELERISEFAELSLNPGDSLVKLRAVKKLLHLVDY